MRQSRSSLVVFVAAFLLTAGGFRPSAAETKAECEKRAETCSKACMGNDTPTERANCLKTCPDKNTCVDSPAPGPGSGAKFDPGPSPNPPRRLPFFVLPEGGVFQQQ